MMMELQFSKRIKKKIDKYTKMVKRQCDESVLAEVLKQESKILLLIDEHHDGIQNLRR
jgi:hypothetical protein